MREVILKEIDDRTYQIFQVEIKTALKLLTRLTKLIGEPIGMIGGAMAAGGNKTAGGVLDQDVPADVWQRAARAFVERLDEGEILDLIEKLVAPIHVQTENDKGQRQVRFATDFHGRPGHLIKVVMAALEANYADFFDGDNVLAGIARRALT